MAEPDATLNLIAAQFTRYNVEKSGGRYVIVDCRTADPVARLRPIEGTIASSSFIGRTSRSDGRRLETWGA
jgi:hypothetical protein